MPTTATQSNSKSSRKGKGRAKASALATPVKPKVMKRKTSTGRRPGAKAWLVTEQRLVGHCRGTFVSRGAGGGEECKILSGEVIKLRKPTGSAHQHPLCQLAHAINNHIDVVNGTQLLNDNQHVLQELAESIEAEFTIAEEALDSVKNSVPVFSEIPEEVQGVVDDGEDDQGAEGDAEEEEHSDKEELPGDEGLEIEELADGKAPDGKAPDSGDIIEVVYQPPTPDPAPDSPIWDIEKDGQSSEEPPAQAAPVRARPKMVSPTKGQPVLFEHVAPIPSTSAKPAAPMAPASFPLLKTKTTLTPAAKANKAVASAAKPTTSSAKPSMSAAKPSMPATKPSTSAAKPSTSTKVEAQGPEQILEYTVPKHAPASKSVTQGSKRASTSKKLDEAPAMKKAKKAPTVVLSSSDAEVVEGSFIDGLVNNIC
ncbi:hypothetical protein FRC11_001035 [Ceratobasidium sp. 423]|nr:hypothetical protein FRC11_001035 [Ceratobasidium sp. 423]